MSTEALAVEVTLTIDGTTVFVPKGTTIFDAARLNGIAIPTLCHQQNEKPVGVCRLCVVDAGQRVFPASCVREAEPGMKIETANSGVVAARKTLVQLLMSDHPSPCARQQHTHDCELETLAAALDVRTSPFPAKISIRGHDDSSSVIAVDHESCILCDRCIRGCDEVRHNWVLARRGKGYQAGIAFDNNLPMGSSSCVSCGECMISCPTGALTNKQIVGTTLEQGEVLDPAELLGLPVFHNVSGTFLQLNQHAVVKRHFKAGELVCREGDYGSSAFYILQGKASVYLESVMGHVATQAEPSFFRKLTSLLRPREEHVRSEEGSRKYIPIDAGIDLAYENPVAELGPGELFGEMTCMSYYPRSATVRATTDCVMLEMLRNVLDILQRNKNFREQLDRNYRARALDTHLRSVPIFADLDPGFMDDLRPGVELIRYAPGQTIFAQGDAGDSFYLVRLGFVKVAEQHPGGDLVLAYIPRGGFFGEMALLSGAPRSATCTALDHVEVARINKKDFDHFLERYPVVRQRMEAEAASRRQQNQASTKTQHLDVDQFLSQGLMEAQSLLLLDLDRCTRCDQCVRACADAHDGVSRLVREGLRFDHYLVATSCRQCRDPLCMVGCPVGSIRRRNSLEVIIEDWCIGCGLCANSCPYGNINMHPFPLVQEAANGWVDGRSDHRMERHVAESRVKATSCDLCHDHAEPSCVYACPHDAAHRVNPLQFFAKVPTRMEGQN